ncbi:MAG TPA: cobalamin-binding protein [Syntrophomonadaceae bacterium]|nr:cobalamin-binding protein [Syntrophomonadaceae bacterium]
MKLFNRKSKMLIILMSLILTISFTGCKGSVKTQTESVKNTNKSFPVTITDDLGRKVTLKAEPKRIVSLAPSNTEILFYLGLGDKVVGDTTYCDYPEEAKHRAKVGGFEEPSLEKIVALKPDLVLATGMHLEMIKGLEDAGLNVLVFKPNTIEKIFNTMQTIGKAAGTEDKAVDLTKELKARVNTVSQKAVKIPENQRPTVYYEMWYQPLMSVGRNTLIGQIIKLAGGTNITDDCTEQYPQISEEVIIEKNPQVMINSYGHDAKKITPEEIAARKGWKDIAFVKNNRIYTIDSDILTLPGPRIVDGLEELAEYLYPERK